MPVFDQRNQQIDQQINVAGNYYAAPLTALTAAAPAPPVHFTGRAADLAELKQQLTAGGTVAVTALQGMGGIGKTALARQLAAELAGHFTGGVFWGSLVDHGGRAQPILRVWGRTCAQDLAEEQDPAALAELVRGLLAARLAEEGPLLAIVDDVRPTWLEGARLLQGAVPVGAPLLLTTRDEGLAATLGATIHRLDALPLGEAHTLLDRLVGDGVTAGDEDAAKDLLEAVGCLPLAIELAAGRLKLLLRKPGFQLRTFVEEVVVRSQETLALRGHPGLAATFAVTYEALAPEQQQLFRTLGVFAPGPLALAYVACVLEQEAAAVELRLDELVAAAYLGYNQAQPGRYILHPLLRDYAARLLTAADEREGAEGRHLACFLGLAEANQAAEPSAWDQLEAALPDLQLAVQTAVRRQEHAAVRSFGHALYGISEFLPTRGYNQLARAVLGHMLEACRALEDTEGQAAALGSLGIVAREQGDYAAARTYLEQALELHTRLGNPLGQANALGNLGNVASDQGDNAAALTYHEQALELHTRLGSPLGQAAALGNLGIVAREQSDYAAARTYLEQALAIDTRLGNPLGQANALGNLGTVAIEQGDYAAARTYHEQALELNTHLGNPLGQAQALGNLGIVAMEQGDYTAALTYHEQALEIDTRLGNPRGQANDLGNLGNVASDQGDYAAARTYLEQALELHTRLGNPLGQANQLGNLGTVASDQGDYAAALTYHEQALEIFTRFGNPRGQANQLGNLGIVASNQGDYAAALTYLERSATLYEQIGLPVHPAVAQALDRLAKQDNGFWRRLWRRLQQ